jgi:hypothetical protein
VEKSPWAAEMKELLLNLQEQVNEAKGGNATGLTSGQISHWWDKYDNLLTAGRKAHPLPEKQKGKRGALKENQDTKPVTAF